MKVVVVYHNLNNDTYYYKINSGTYRDYKVGDINQYNHQVIVVIKNIYTEQYVIKQYFSLRKMVLTPLIAFLQKLNRDYERR